MKLSEAIRRADDIKPNAFSTETKTAWLNEVEGMVQTEIFLWASEQIIVYDPAADAEAELLVAPPHDKLYPAYLAAMIDYANGEYKKYQNSMQMFNSMYREFMRWFATYYRPADTHEDVYTARYSEFMQWLAAKAKEETAASGEEEA